MFIDSHCHLDRLDLTPYQGDLSIALDAARVLGVERFLAISVDLDDYPVLMDICQQHADVSMSAGVHPCEDLAMLQRASVDTLVQLASHSKVWAIGETGLDYHHAQDLKDAQRQSFVNHIAAAKIVNKPLVVHTREARADTIAVLQSEQANQGILHCFTEDWDTAKAALDLGFYISFSGIVSFKNAQSIREVVAKMPRDRLLIETDSPYLAPMPYRGKSNEPKYVPLVADAIANVWQLSTAEVGAISTDNFKRLFANAYKALAH